MGSILWFKTMNHVILFIACLGLMIPGFIILFGWAIPLGYLFNWAVAISLIAVGFLTMASSSFGWSKFLWCTMILAVLLFILMIVDVVLYFIGTYSYSSIFRVIVSFVTMVALFIDIWSTYQCRNQSFSYE
eukprot:TRINITY_DN11650_c0_g1_i1.p1 TRINITY_DN11650_c0_g1~~TRINITY_DN11650_c0_g1_i1.p1  ORF type:complete len:139 (+),score=18.62 TRINITY_DN11650_c0_g1_i1:26-418(+)